MKKVTQTQNNRQDHWLLGGNPRAIEAQEEAGQQELARASQLPAKINNPRAIDAKAAYERMGILVYPFSEKIARIFKEQVKKIDNDPIFVSVILPSGWKIEPTDHSMWSNLKDGGGRIRASVFYKAAFYDRDAFSNLICRYEANTAFVDLSPDAKGYDQYAFVVDNSTGEELFKTPAFASYDEGRPFRQQAQDFIAANFPDHADFAAYW